MIKKIFFGLLLFATFSFPSYAKDSKKTAGAPLDKIVAIVNSNIITKNELDQRIAMMQRLLAANNPAAIKTATLRKQALDSLIDNSLQLQLAQRNGIQISAAELDSVIANIAKSNHVTVEQMKKSLQEQEGLSFTEYREQLREQILINKVEQQFLGKDIVISDQEVQKILRNPPPITSAATKYHIVDILIEIPDDTSPAGRTAAINTAKQIAMKLKQGANIEKLAQEHNTAKQQISNNDLGWRTINELPNLFAKEITNMQVKQVAGPLEAPNGLHFIQLLEKQGGPIKFTKEKAQDFLFHQKFEKLLKPWLKELRATAYIKIIN